MKFLAACGREASILHGSTNRELNSVTRLRPVPQSASPKSLGRVALALRILLLPLVALALGRLIPTELGILTVHTAVGATIGDVLYFSHAAFGLMQGHAPYQPNFLTRPDQGLPYLYPPLTLLISLPAVLGGSQYLVAFSITILFASLVGCAVLGHFARRLGFVGPVGLAVAVLLAATGPVWLTRVDSLQGLLVAGSALALVGGRRALAVVLVTLACLVKETAVLAAVPVGLWCLLPDRENPLPWPQRVREVLLGLVPALLIFVVFLIWSSGGEVTSSLTSVHRGMELESIPASVAIALSHFIPVHPYLGGLGSEQLRGADVSALAVIAISLGTIVVGVGSVLLALGHRRPATAMALAVAVGLCATPVLSPQYLLDLLPILAVAAYADFPRAGADRLIALDLLLAVLTQAEFPYLFGSAVGLHPLGLAALLLRNSILILVAAILSRRIPWSQLGALVRA